MKDLKARLVEATRQSRQVAKLEKGHRIRVQKLELVCDVAEPPETDGKNRRLLLLPVPCGPRCPEECDDCCYSWFANRQGEKIPLTRPSTSKMTAAGGEAAVEAILLEFRQLRGESNGSGSAEAVDENESSRHE